MLRDEIAGLLAEDFDLSLLGITGEDLDALLRDPEQPEGGAVEGEDDIPEPPVTPVSVAGDLWQLGSHRLICGDSTAADVVRRLLGDVKPLLMVTDPSYGVEYDTSWRNQAGAAKTKRTGKVLNDDRADWREACAMCLSAVRRSRSKPKAHPHVGRSAAGSGRCVAANRASGCLPGVASYSCGPR